jgi:hypothetical protein
MYPKITDLPGVTTTSPDITSALESGLSAAPGTYLVPDGEWPISPLVIGVPGIRLLSPSGKGIFKLVPNAARRAIAGFSSICPITILAGRTSLQGIAVDMNRGAQDQTAFNTPPAPYTTSPECDAIQVRGGEGALLEEVSISVSISNAIRFGLYTDQTSGLRGSIHCVDSGGIASFRRDPQLQFGDVEGDSIDHMGWKIYPHSIDVFSCSGSIGRMIATNVFGTGTALSDWVSGFTLTCNDSLQVGPQVFRMKDGVTKMSVGMSMLNNSRLQLGDAAIIGVTDNAYEWGGNVDCTADCVLIDGEYRKPDPTAQFAGIGMAVYANGYYRDFLSRSLRATENCSFNDIKIRRTLGAGLHLNEANNIRFGSLSVRGCKYGIYEDYSPSNQSFPTANMKPQTIRGLHVADLDLCFNELDGHYMKNGQRTVISYGNVSNNNQARNQTGGAEKNHEVPGLNSGGVVFATATTGLADKSGYRMVAGDLSDNQADIDVTGSFNPACPTIVSTNAPNLVEVGSNIMVEQSQEAKVVRLRIQGTNGAGIGAVSIALTPFLVGSTPPGYPAHAGQSWTGSAFLASSTHPLGLRLFERDGVGAGVGSSTDTPLVSNTSLTARSVSRTLTGSNTVALTMQVITGPIAAGASYDVVVDIAVPTLGIDGQASKIPEINMLSAGALPQGWSVSQPGTDKVVTVSELPSASLKTASRVKVRGASADEIIVSDPLGTPALVTGTGAISTTGRNVTGLATLFASEITGRFWIKVGPDYRQIATVAGNLSATLTEAFPANLSGVAFEIVKHRVRGLASQTNGYVGNGEATPQFGVAVLSNGNMLRDI